MEIRSLLLLLVASVFLGVRVTATFKSRLIHRFSEEMRGIRASRSGNGSGLWPEKRSVEFYQLLMSNDFQRQKMKLGTKYQLLFPSEGTNTLSLGNDFGWLHYTWIDIGTPNVSFLVALDAGSDLFWVPCDCRQCAPLSSNNYDSLDRGLNEYNPSASSSSKHISCSHHLCESGPKCKSPKQQCPYTMDYYTENTASSGLLVEDILHLASGSRDTLNSPVQAPVILGCGMKQSGSYLDGIAPDGLMGLGLGEISVPSFLAKAGLARNSFSMCFVDNDFGSLYFGDMGPANQQSASFLPLDGKNSTYIVGVEACCIGNSCLNQTSFRALVDTGSSFTYLPKDVYERVAEEFDSQVNATRSTFEGFPWKYCYKSSSDQPHIPSVKLMFPLNNNFVVQNPVFPISYIQGPGFCLAIQPSTEDIGIIGQNYMTGHHLVFDRENFKLGWSHSNCQDLGDDQKMPLTSPNKTVSNPLPTTEQQSTPDAHAVSPAVAGRAPSKPSVASTIQRPSQFCFLKLLTMLLSMHLLVLSK